MRLGWFNVFHVIVLVIMLTPNLIYAMWHKNDMNRCANRLMNLLEQVGRYGCMLFMVLPIGSDEFGFYSVLDLLLYAAILPILLAVYLGLWELELGEIGNKLLILFTVSGLIALIGWLFFGLEMGSPIAVILLTPVLGMLLLKKVLRNATRKTKMAMAIIPVLIFLLCGITLRHIPLILSAVILGIAHPYVTWQNVK
ncbi:hypothetical protein [Butyricicoccus sp.]|uniref:hypothetical protein n=1 Tax=Butyricicoccus sp. TaxID=2049021 RepID=UPI003F17CD3E